MQNAYKMLMISTILCTYVIAGSNFWTPSAAERAHRTELPDYDRIRIYALSGEPFRGNNGFPIRPFDGAVCKIVAETEVTGKEASQICRIWRTLNDESNGSFCHSPPYGFRFYKGEEMAYETSMCWKCNNFYGPDDEGKQTWYGLKRDGHSAALLRLCKKLLPHPDLGK